MTVMVYTTDKNGKVVFAEFDKKRKAFVFRKAA